MKKAVSAQWLVSDSETKQPGINLWILPSPLDLILSSFLSFSFSSFCRLTDTSVSVFPSPLSDCTGCCWIASPLFRLSFITLSSPLLSLHIYLFSLLVRILVLVFSAYPGSPDLPHPKQHPSLSAQPPLTPLSFRICGIDFYAVGSLSLYAMACSSQSVTIESYPEAAVASAYATPGEDTGLLRDRRRRHSFHTARKLSCDYDADAVFLRVRRILVFTPNSVPD